MSFANYARAVSRESDRFTQACWERERAELIATLEYQGVTVPQPIRLDLERLRWLHAGHVNARIEAVGLRG